MGDDVTVPDGEDLAAEAAAATAAGGPSSTLARDNDSTPGDWVDCGWQVIVPAMTEHALAEHLWAADSEGTRWHGGNNAAYDVSNRDGRVDAKTAWYGSGIHKGRLFFSSPDQFDPEKVDVVAPVVLAEPRVQWAVQPSGGGRVVGVYDDAEIWMIPVAILNALKQRHSKVKSSVLLSDVEEFKV